MKQSDNINNLLRLNPGISVGPFYFGTLIKEYNSYGVLKKNCNLLDIPGTNSSTYGIPRIWDDLDIITIDELIYHIHIEKYLYYNSKNILECSLVETMEIIDCQQYSEKEWIDCTGEERYYFEHLGLDIWVLNGIVTSATCAIAQNL